MRVGIGVVAGGPQLFSAELAVATGDGEGNNDPVAAAEVRDFFTRFLGDADEFVSQDVAFFHGGNEAIEQMQVRPANRCPGYLNHGIVRIEDRGIGNVAEPQRCRCPSSRALSSMASRFNCGLVRSGRNGDLFAIHRPFHIRHGAGVGRAVAPRSLGSLLFLREL